MSETLMTPDLILFDIEANNQETAIRQIAGALDQCGRLLDLEGYLNDVGIREKSSSTAVGIGGIATPHAKSACVKSASLAFARLSQPIQWDEEEQVKLIFLIAVPLKEQGDRHLQIISSLFRKMVYEEFLEQLDSSDCKEKIMALVDGV